MSLYKIHKLSVGFARSFMVQRFFHKLGNLKPAAFPFKQTDFRLMDHISIESNSLNEFLSLTQVIPSCSTVEPSSSTHFEATKPFLYGQKRYASSLTTDQLKRIKAEIKDFKQSVCDLTNKKNELNHSIVQYKASKQKSTLPRDLNIPAKTDMPSIDYILQTIQTPPKIHIPNRSDLYHTFLRVALKDLRISYPEKIHNERMKIVGNKWRSLSKEDQNRFWDQSNTDEKQQTQKSKEAIKKTLFHNVFLPEEIANLKSIYGKTKSKGEIKEMVNDKWNNMTFENRIRYRDSRGLNPNMFPVNKIRRGKRHT